VANAIPKRFDNAGSFSVTFPKASQRKVMSCFFGRVSVERKILFTLIQIKSRDRKQKFYTFN